jgi:aryl-alcohol dehydrogenase-like predicted oxidoreductase
MEYRKLGNSELKVSVCGLGANNFGWGIEVNASIAVIHHALTEGINFIDTADMYDQGRSEEFVGKAIKDRRSQVVLASKFGFPMGDDPANAGGSAYYVKKALHASLQRLQTDYIDLYQLHLPDPNTPIEVTLRALDDVVREGKVRYIGCSNFAAWQLCDALWTSKVNTLSSFVTVQNRYNLLDRHIERELVPFCQTHNVGIIPWGPLAGGFLTGKYRRDQDATTDMRLSSKNLLSNPYRHVQTETNWRKLDGLVNFAAKRGHSAGELALAWLLTKPCISTVIAGAKNADQVTANIRACSWKLTDEEVAEVDTLTVSF